MKLSKGARKNSAWFHHRPMECSKSSLKLQLKKWKGAFISSNESQIQARNVPRRSDVLLYITPAWQRLSPGVFLLHGVSVRCWITAPEQVVITMAEL